METSDFGKLSFRMINIIALFYLYSYGITNMYSNRTYKSVIRSISKIPS